VKWLAYTSGVSVRQAHAADVARIVMFHGVGDAYYPVDAFEEQLQFLTANFDVLTLGDAVARLRAGEIPTGREVVLTFDDGLRNNATVAAPLLEQYNVPATFFLCPGLIDDEAWLWSAESRARLSTLDPQRLAQLRIALHAPIPEEASPEVTIETSIEWMKSLTREDRERAELRIRHATPGWTPSADEHISHDMMSWSDVEGLDPTLITIGAHTVNHPTLTTLDDEELRFEVAECRTILEERLGRPVEFFCYPNGIEDDRVRAIAAANYTAAVTVEVGPVEAEPDLYRLPRVGAVPSAARLAWRLHRP
jgi:peptidoglycan/xylan/chitin deacetylase (PgdA/CDA1 family)